MPQHKLSHAVNTATHGLVAAPLVAAQTTRRWWQDFSFTGYMTPASRVFLALMVVELLTVVGLTIQRMIHPTTSYSERYAVLMLVDVCILFFFAVNGVLGENSFEVLAFILVTLVFCGVTIYQFFWSPANTEQVVLWIRFIAVCAFTPANCLLAILVYRGFGWRMYRKIGADESLAQSYRMYQFAVSVIKIDCAVGINLVLMAGIFLHENQVELAIDISALVVGVLGWSIIGLVAIRKELKRLFILFMLLSLLTPAYVMFKGQEYIRNQSKAGFLLYPIFVAGITAIVCRVLCIVSAAICRSNFETGLLPVFESEENTSERQQAERYAIDISEHTPLSP